MKGLFLLVTLALISCGKDDSAKDYQEDVCSLNFKIQDAGQENGSFVDYTYSAPLDKDIDNGLENKDKCTNFLSETSGHLSLTVETSLNETSSGSISSINFSQGETRNIDLNDMSNFSENPLYFNKKDVSYTINLNEDTHPLPSFENKWKEWDRPWPSIPNVGTVMVRMPINHNPSALPSIINIKLKALD